MGRQEAYQLANAIELTADDFAECVAELLHGRLDLHDDHIVGQRPEVARHDERIVQRYDAGHRFGHRAMNLVGGRQDAVPAIRGDGAGLAAPLYRADDDGPLEPLFGRLVFETLNDRDGVVAQVLHHDVIGPRRLLQSIGDLDADRVIAEVTIADTGDDHAQVYPPSSSTPHAQVLTSRVITPASEWMCVVHGMHGSKLRIARRMSMPLNCCGSFASSNSGVLSTASS